MFDALIGNWWTVALRGTAALGFGILVLLVPGLTLGGLVSLFGLYALADGGLALLLGARAGGRPHGAGAALLDGAVGIAVGVLTLLWPQISVLVLMLLAALRAIASGALQLRFGLQARRAGGDWLLAVAGAAGVALGLLLVAVPAAWVLALQAIAAGAILAPLALRLRALAHDTAHDGAVAAA